MKRLMLLSLVCTLFFSCMPVLRADLLTKGTRDLSFTEMLRAPDTFKSKLYIFGGTIITSRSIDAGILLEATYMPVDSNGYPNRVLRTQERYLALFPKEKGGLDLTSLSRGREVTIAGLFLGAQPVKIQDKTYVYPLFRIEQIHFWNEKPLLEQGDLPPLYRWELPHQGDRGTFWPFNSPVP
jgi:outer membrane lipoprotein